MVPYCPAKHLTVARFAVHSMLQRRNELISGTVTAHEPTAHHSHLLCFQPFVLVEHKTSTHPAKLVGGQQSRCGVQKMHQRLRQPLLFLQNLVVLVGQEAAVGMSRPPHVTITVRSLPICTSTKEHAACQNLSEDCCLVAAALFCASVTPQAAFEPGAPPIRAIRGRKHLGGRVAIDPVVPLSWCASVWGFSKILSRGRDRMFIK